MFCFFNGFFSRTLRLRLSSSPGEDPVLEPAGAAASLVHPLRRGRQSSTEHQVAVQQHATDGDPVHLHAAHPGLGRRFRPTRLPLPQQAHSPQQRQLHTLRGEHAGPSPGHGQRQVHGKPV